MGAADVICSHAIKNKPFQCSDGRNSPQRRRSAARVEQGDFLHPVTFKFQGSPQIDRGPARQQQRTQDQKTIRNKRAVPAPNPATRYPPPSPAASTPFASCGPGPRASRLSHARPGDGHPHQSGRPPHTHPGVKRRAVSPAGAGGCSRPGPTAPAPRRVRRRAGGRGAISGRGAEEDEPLRNEDACRGEVGWGAYPCRGRGTLCGCG